MGAPEWNEIPGWGKPGHYDREDGEAILTIGLSVAYADGGTRIGAMNGCEAFVRKIEDKIIIIVQDCYAEMPSESSNADILSAVFNRIATLGEGWGLMMRSFVAQVPDELMA